VEARVVTLDKVDADVLREFDRVAEHARDARVPVIIEAVQPAQVDSAGEPRNELAKLEQRVRESQRGIIERLEQLGAVGMHPMTLANAVSVELTRSQLSDIASHPDVRRIHLARPAQVTT
jgi:hypothetical protein